MPTYLYFDYPDIRSIAWFMRMHIYLYMCKPTHANIYAHTVSHTHEHIRQAFACLAHTSIGCIVVYSMRQFIKALRSIMIMCPFLLVIKATFHVPRHYQKDIPRSVSKIFTILFNNFKRVTIWLHHFGQICFRAPWCLFVWQQNWKHLITSFTSCPIC